MPPIDPNHQILCDFLRYAYVPSLDRAKERAAWWSRLFADRDVPTFSTAPEARDLLARIVSDLLGDRAKVKIGVTSGYDSRGVLGALVSVLPPERIVAFTRGQPGNPDFEKARGFTRTVLPVHHLLPTQKSEFVVDDLVAGASVHPSGGPRVITPSTKNLTTEIDEFSSLPNVSGYLGDALTGKRVNLRVQGDFDAARARFLNSNSPFIPLELSEEFFPRGYDAGHALPVRPLIPIDQMDPQDQFNFLYRQFQRIGVNAGQYEADDLARMEPDARARAVSRMAMSLTPYTDPRWQKSWMLVPLEERNEQRFYKRFLSESYPEIFSDLVAARDKGAAWTKPPRPPKPPQPPGPAPSFWRQLRSRAGALVRGDRPVPLPARPASAARPSPPKSKAEIRALSALRTHTNWEMLYESNEAFRTEYCEPLLRSLAARRGLWFDPMRVHELAREEAYGYGTVLWGLLSMETAIRAGRLPEPG